MSFLTHPSVRRYGLVVGSVAVALLIAFALAASGWMLRFIFLPAVVVSTWHGGIRAGVVAAVASVLLFDYFLNEPPGTVKAISSQSLVHLGTFLFVAGTTAWLAARASAFKVRLETTLASIGDAVIVTSAEGRITFMNPVAETTTGWPAREGVGRRIDQLFRVVDEQTREPVSVRSLFGGKMGEPTGNIVLIGRDGTERPIETNGAAIRDEGGSLAGAVLVFRDTTERRGSERGRALLASIVESSGDAIYTKDLAGTITSWNAAAERMFGYTAEEMTGRSAAILTLPDRADEEPSILARIARGEGIDHFETVRIGKDARRIDVSLTISPVRDPAGRVVGASSIARDVTDRKIAEAELERLFLGEQQARTRAEDVSRMHQSLEQRLALLVDASGSLLRSPQLDAMLPQLLQLSSRLVAGADAYALWSRDPLTEEWRILGAEGLSETYQQAAVAGLRSMPQGTGVRFDGPMIIENLAEASPPGASRDAIAAEGLQALVAIPLRINEVLRGSLTFYYRRPHQFEEIDVRAATALGNLAAAAIGTAELYEEQTRLRAEAQVSERRSAFLAEASRILGSSLDYEATLQSVAAVAVPRLADWCMVDMLEGETTRRLATVHSDPEKVALARALRGKFPLRFSDSNSITGVLRTGEPAFLPEIAPEMLEPPLVDQPDALVAFNFTSYLCVPLLSHGRVLGALTFLTAESGRHYAPGDLEVAQELARRASLAVENARLYQQAQEASRTKDEFLATLSHEMRTPLNAMLGWARLLGTGKLDQARQERAISTIERNAEAQTQLIDDLLDVSRFITGNLRLDVRPVQLSSVIEAAIDSVRIAAEAKEIDLHASLDPAVGPVAGDANRLQQVVWNLLSNAIKFTPRGGEVGVSLERLESSARIQVRDSGQGISPRFLPFVFERFRQADSTSTRVHGGLGLGLAIVRHLVEVHGGTVEVASAGEGKGATFTVDLPITHGRAEVLVPRGRRFESAPHGVFDPFAQTLEGVEVVVVEDDTDGRDFLVMVLEQAGATVRAVGSAAEALMEVERACPDVILSDIGMPGEDGFRLIQRIRELRDPERARIPAAALTGFARPEDRARVIAAGFQTHVAKPVEPGDLVQTVVSLVGRNVPSTGA